ncbi:hypothetical protein [uncultured Bacteroides sp.]|uniref:hypothetical protein n=1 Tax=uncultured Bacteroides sp. TaxID=162156 RepID=UPI002630D2FE|nr:hypothetical protein [uncultured Bacteroides sp.]
MRKKSLVIAFILPLTYVGTTMAQESITTQTIEVQSDTIYPEYEVYEKKYKEKILNPTRFRDNWFFGVGVGTTISMCEFATSNDFVKRLRPAGMISIGKWISPWGGIRLQGTMSQGYSHSNPASGINDSYHWRNYTFYGDGIFNLTNLVPGFTAEFRRFQLMALVGVGATHVGDYQEKDWYGQAGVSTKGRNLFTFHAGLIASVRLSNHWCFNLEANGTILDGSYGGIEDDNKNNGLINVFAGLVYRVKNHDGSYGFTYVQRNTETIKQLNQEINRLRAEVKADTIKGKVIDLNQHTTLISFQPGKTEIDQLQEVNVYTAAQAYNKEQCDVYISPDSVIESEEQYSQRANNIKDVLMKHYSVPADRIRIITDRKEVEEVPNCVILYIVK